MKEQDAAHSFEKYRIRYDNDTGPRDESFWEWWTVVEIESDEDICKCDKEQMAIDIAKSLTELTRLRSELQQKDEIIKELVNVAARISIQLKKGDSYRVHIESLIKKANVF